MAVTINIAIVQFVFRRAHPAADFIAILDKAWLKGFTAFDEL